MVAFLNTKPPHPRLTNTVSNLKRCRPGEVGGQAVDQQLNLHLRDLRDVVVNLFHIGRKLRNRVTDVLLLFANRLFGLQLFLHLSNHRQVFFQQLRVFAVDHLFNLPEVITQTIKNTGQQLAVLRLPVQLVEHLIRIINWRHRLIRAGVRHPRPGVRSIRNHDTKFQRTKTRASFRVRLELVLQKLINRNSHRPTSRRVRTALNIARVQFDSRQQTTNPAHVPIAIALDTIVHAMQRHHLIFERLQWFQDPLEFKVCAECFRPEVFWNHTVRTKHKHKPLLAFRFWREHIPSPMREAGQVQSKVRRRRTHAGFD